MSYETVEMGAGRAEWVGSPSTAPRRSTPGPASSARELGDVVNERATPTPRVRAVLVTGAGRGFSSGADLKAGFDPNPDDGAPDVRKELHEVYHPIMHGHPAPREAGGSRGQRARRGHRALAGTGLRPGAGGRVGLLRSGLREHWAYARRRLDAVRARGHRQGSGLPDGTTRRARARSSGARLGPGELRARRRRADAGEAGGTGGAPGPRPDALLRGLEAGSEPDDLPAISTASSIWRPRSSTPWRGRERLRRGRGGLRATSAIRSSRAPEGGRRRITGRAADMMPRPCPRA